MTYKSERVRVAALVSYYAAKCSGVSPLQVLRSMLADDEYADIKAPTQFIRDVVTKWQHHGEVANLFSMRVSSHPKKVPDEIIRKCATIIQAGYNVELLVASGSGQVSGQATKHQVHRYYGSIKEACQKDGFLEGVIREYGVTYDYMRTRLHEVDRSLALRRVEFKYMLTEGQMMNRRSTAAFLLNAWRADASWLSRVWWLDETSMWIIDNDNPTQLVWADAHDEGVRVVLNTPHIAAHRSIKVHVIAAVNALLGAVWCDFTTGTTDIVRRTPDLNAPYKVGEQYQWYPSGPQLCVQPSSSCCMQCT
jgi:hypothetical protein